MNLKYINKFPGLVVFLLLACLTKASAQPEQIVDQVAAVIGSNILLKSEIENAVSPDRTTG
jgi:hypothetical protein